MVSGEKIAGRGEDAYLLDRHLKKQVFLGVFDGCGGSGARIYPEFGEKTGAYIASRVAALATKRWLMKKTYPVSSLESEIKGALDKCNQRVSSSSFLKGSIIKDFPTTISALLIDTETIQRRLLSVTTINAGDSRCYGLFPDGLAQLTRDDLVSQDALQSLYDSAPMTNMLCASEECKVNFCRQSIILPCILFASTDGCFDYFRSPMEFEYMLLDTMQSAGSAADWERKIKKSIGKIAGDDYTMLMISIGFQSFGEIKKQYHHRFEVLRQICIGLENPDVMWEKWEIYRKGYERFLDENVY